jgi:hypothetical protein
MMEQLQGYYSRSMSEVSEKRVFPRDYCANRAFLQKGNLRMPVFFEEFCEQQLRNLY